VVFRPGISSFEEQGILMARDLREPCINDWRMAELKGLPCIEFTSKDTPGGVNRYKIDENGSIHHAPH
jgi:hypothetical protein